MRKIVVLLVLLFPLITFAVSVSVDNFDSYSTGGLAGQGSWATDGGNNMTVGTAVVQAGVNSVGAVDSDLTGFAVKKTVTSHSSGTTTVYMRASGFSTVHQFRLYEGATFVGLIQFRPDATVRCSGATDSDMGTASANTWYQMDINFNGATDKIQCRFNGATYSAVVSSANAFTNVDAIRMNGGSDSTGSTYYYDTITYDDGTVAAATLTSIAGLVRAFFIW